MLFTREKLFEFKEFVIEYHQLRTIYQQSKKQSKFLHPHIQRLYDQFRISSKIEDIDLNFLQLINH